MHDQQFEPSNNNLDYFDILGMPKNTRARKTPLTKYIKIAQMDGISQARKNIDLDHEVGIIASNTKWSCHKKLDELEKRLKLSNNDFNEMLKETLKLLCGGTRLKTTKQLSKLLGVEPESVKMFFEWLKEQDLACIILLTPRE